MVKYLSCPDLHWAKQWLETSKMIFEKIIQTAESEKADFVLFPGDMFDTAIYATDNGGINDLLAYLTRLNKICPTAAIYGTPSHDRAGCYGPLEKTGLQILQPGETYGYFSSQTIGESWNTAKIVNTAGIMTPADCLLFGIPEVTKSWYQANNPTVDASEVNGNCVKLVNDIFKNEIAPIRTAYPDIPAICMLHGNVTDAMDRGSEKDIILKASDIVIHTADMAVAELTRIELGHIHTPWESKKICAGYTGYAGIDKNAWCKLGFIPAMSLVEVISPHETNITRLPYGTPERRKITKPLATYDHNIAYWLFSKNVNDVNPADNGAHEWSRVTYDIDTAVERRIDTAGVEEAQTLPELGKLYDPDMTKSQLAKLAEAEQHTSKPPVVSRDVRVTKVEVTGCTLLHDKTVSIDINKLPAVLVQVLGHNGAGKSSLLGFCSPYPTFIGKDTDSGRSSAIKDFFKNPVSGIKKTVVCNGVTHEHLITIKGAHTQNPKVECYLTINGEPILEKSTFDDMQKKCEELYGSMDEYIMTSFYVQPLQGKYNSGLMTANMTNVRDIVQNIAGINHESEKRYALDKVNAIDSEIKEERVKIDTELELLADIQEVKNSKENAENELKTIENDLKIAKTEQKNAENAYNAKKAIVDRIQDLQERAKKLQQEIENIDGEIFTKEHKASDLRAESCVELVQKKLDDDAKIKQEYQNALEQKSEVDKRNADKMAEYQKIANRMQEILYAVDRKKAEAKEAFNTVHNVWKDNQNKVSMAYSQKKYLTDRIDTINKPCPNCGYIAPDVAETIKSIQAEITAVEQDIHDIGPEPIYTEPDLSAERAEYGKLQAVKKPESELFLLPSKGLSESEIQANRELINEASAKRAEANSIENDVLPGLRKRKEDLTAELSGIVIPEAVDITLESGKLQRANLIVTDLSDSIATAKAHIEAYTQQIVDIENKTIELENRKNAIADKLLELEDWKYISVVLSPSKLPAMELDVVLDKIDTDATKTLKSYRDGCYLFESHTQSEGKKSTIDKFDVLVHDTKTGVKKSFLKYSVGEKTFITDAYTKALIKERLKRTKTSYSPIISDEQDSFVEIPQIPVFYEMQQNYYSDGSRVLAVSHSPDAENYIQNNIHMEDLTK